MPVTPGSAVPTSASTGKIAHWAPTLIFTAISIAVFAAGIAIMDQVFQKYSPPPTIPLSALPASAPVPHNHCIPMLTGRVVPQHRLRVRSRQDIYRLSLVLQEFAHRQGGCFRDLGTEYLLDLPEPAIRQILELDSDNYSEWVSRSRATLPHWAPDDLRQIRFYMTSNNDVPDWQIIAGTTMTLLGFVACVLALAACFATARSQFSQRPKSIDSTPAVVRQL